MFRARVTIFLGFLTFLIIPSQGETFNEVGSQTSRTPYDGKYRKVQTYLASTRKMNNQAGSPSFCRQQSRIQRYLNRVRHFRFQEEPVLTSGKHEDHWQLPEETENLGSGDCEDLAIWLYCHLLDEGFTNIRFTLGLAGSQQKAMHAWITWYERGKAYIIDPSRRGGIYGVDRCGSITYQPCYSYYFERKWHHQ
jgi:predicted transglutaminase-like cysteine proteinase